VKQNGEVIGLHELVDGLLFSLQAEGRSARTVGYYRDLLHLLLKYVQQRGWADSLTALDAHRVREFLSWTGSRICEHSVGNGTKRIRQANLDLDNRRVRILGKGNKIGMAPFSPKTAKALWAWLIQRKSRVRTDRLWITEEGQAFSIEGLVSWFTRLKKRAYVNSPGGVHRLRHTAALQYLRGARDSFLLQLFLRHEDLTMSRRYTQGLKQEEAIAAHRNGASPVEGLGLG